MKRKTKRAQLDFSPEGLFRYWLTGLLVMGCFAIITWAAHIMGVNKTAFLLTVPFFIGAWFNGYRVD